MGRSRAILNVSRKMSGFHDDEMFPKMKLFWSRSATYIYIHTYPYISSIPFIPFISPILQARRERHVFYQPYHHPARPDVFTEPSINGSDG